MLARLSGLVVHSVLAQNSLAWDRIKSRSVIYVCVCVSCQSTLTELASFGEVQTKPTCQCPCRAAGWSRRFLREGVVLLPIANSLLKGKICLKLALSPLGDMKVGWG